MGWCNYLVIPKMKALYDVSHAPLEKEFYTQYWDDLRNLEMVIAENSKIVQESKDLPLKNFTVKALNSMYEIYDALPTIDSYEAQLNIFIAFMMKYHNDAYMINEYDKEVPELKSKGYKVYSSTYDTEE